MFFRIMDGMEGLIKQADELGHGPTATALTKLEHSRLPLPPPTQTAIIIIKQPLSPLHQ
jgi:hypothetical protein